MAVAPNRVMARDILFKIGTTSYSPELNSVELTLGDAPGGVRTFGEVRASGMFSLKLDGYTSNEADSLYRFLWTSFGSTASFTLTPGGGTEGTDNPAYKGTVIFNELPPLTLNAGEEAAFSVTLEVMNTGHDPASHLFYGVTIDTTP